MQIEQCVIHQLGLTPFEEARALQESLAIDIAAGVRPPTLLLLEHPHTFTFGRRGQQANLLWPPEILKQRGIKVHWTDRGGDVTYHGPGQLVGYPLLPLIRPETGLLTRQENGDAHLPRTDYIGYLRKLEQTLIGALANMGVAAAQVPGLTGVWVQPEVASRCRNCPPEHRQLPSKIAALGVKVDARGISRHGFALNVSPDMTYWEGIIGCGLGDYPVTSLAAFLDPAPAMETVMAVVAAAFGQTFGCEIIVEPAPRFQP